MIEFKFHFDGKTIVLDEPVSLPVNTPLIAKIEESGANGVDKTVKRKREWGQYKGMGWMSEDFNDPLPDTFWEGEE